MPKSKYESGDMMKELRKGAANKAYGQKAGQKDAPKPKPPKAGSSDPVDAEEKAKKAEEKAKKKGEQQANFAGRRTKDLMNMGKKKD